MDEGNHVINFNTLFELCSTNFELLNSSMKKIESRVNGVEKQMKLMNKTTQCQSPSLEKIEDKIGFLNQNCQPVFSCDFLTFLHNELSKDKYQTMINNDIIHILNGTHSIYEIACRYLCMISKETMNEQFEKIHSLYAFPYQKYVLYYWDTEKLSWDKMKQDVLNKIFNLIQQHILNNFSNLISNKSDVRLKQIDLVECGSNLYVDNFDKKYNEFKKTIFQEFIS